MRLLKTGFVAVGLLLTMFVAVALATSWGNVSFTNEGENAEPSDTLAIDTSGGTVTIPPGTTIEVRDANDQPVSPQPTYGVDPNLGNPDSDPT